MLSLGWCSAPAPSSSAELQEKGAARVMVLQLFLLTRIGDDAVACGLFLNPLHYDPVV
jgi:hypothetical protein